MSKHYEIERMPEDKQEAGFSDFVQNVLFGHRLPIRCVCYSRWFPLSKIQVKGPKMACNPSITRRNQIKQGNGFLRYIEHDKEVVYMILRQFNFVNVYCSLFAY